MIMKNLCGLTAGEISRLITSYGFSSDHALSIAKSIYKRQTTEISNISKIPKKLKVELASSSFIGIISPLTYEVSVDKTVKYIFRTNSGIEFETVYIPDNKRNTVCVSTQSGCRMGCPFCVTAKYGFRGNLSAGEIISQILSIPESREVTHIVFMGMGEPMDNLENVLVACEILTSEWGLSISPRNITVSSVGITPGIERFLRSTDCNLTISLHSPFSEEREKIVPLEKVYPVNDIINILKGFSVKKYRRISLAYLIIKDFNDTDIHIEALKALLAGTKIRVNLLPYHTIPGDINVSSSSDRMLYFKHQLIVSGISSSIRKSRGVDISAACGLLAADLQKKEVEKNHLKRVI